MIELNKKEPMSRFGGMILIATLVLFVFGAISFIFAIKEQNNKQSVATIVPVKKEVTIVDSPKADGYHLIKVTKGDIVTLHLEHCTSYLRVQSCDRLGYSWDPKSPSQVKDAEETYQFFVNYKEQNEIVEVIH